MIRTHERQFALVVEDDPDLAAYLAECLRAEGFGVDVALDGDEALGQVARRPPDIVTLDIQMPGQSGLHFFRRFRSMAEFGSTPVVVITGLTKEDPDWDQFIHTFLDREGLVPPAAYLEKPVRLDQLKAAVADQLDGETKRRGA